MDKRGEASLGGVLAAVLSWWWLLVLCVILGLMVSLGAESRAPATYEAVTTVQVYGYTRAPDMPTEQIIASSETVAAVAAEALADGSTAAQLRDVTSVGNPSGSQVLRFRVLMSDPQEASDVANAYGDAYLAVREQQLVQTDPRAAEGLAGGSIVERAETPTAESGPDKYAYIAGGLALGLLAGIVLALIADRLDPRVRNARRMQHLFYDEVLVSGGSPAETSAIVALIGQRTSLEGGNPKVALLGDDPELVEKLVPFITRQSVAVASGAGGGVLEREPAGIDLINAASLAAPAEQVAAAMDCGLAVIVAGKKSRRGQVLGLNSQYAVVTGRSCLGWFVKA